MFGFQIASLSKRVSQEIPRRLSHLLFRCTIIYTQLQCPEEKLLVLREATEHTSIFLHHSVWRCLQHSAKKKRNSVKCFHICDCNKYFPGSDCTVQDPSFEKSLTHEQTPFLHRNKYGQRSILSTWSSTVLFTITKTSKQFYENSEKAARQKSFAASPHLRTDTRLAEVTEIADDSSVLISVHLCTWHTPINLKHNGIDSLT